MQIVHVSAEKFGTSTISETVFAVLKASAKKAKAAKA
jgi:hypothetical protein